MSVEASIETCRFGAPEGLASHEKPLKGAVYVCIGASRPDRSIGGPTAIALAQEGADVFITGADPSKVRKAEKVFSDVLDAGALNSGHGTFDVSTEAGIVLLVNEVQRRYGQVDGLLYYPAGGLVGDNEEERIAHGQNLNERAPVRLTTEFLSRGLIKQGGFIQMMPSIYSWGYPTVLSPDPRYNPVAESKHSGEMAMHAMVPELQRSGVSLVFVVGHAVDGTFAARYLTKDLTEAETRAMMATTDMDGQQKSPAIIDMTQATVDVATKARKGMLGPVHTQFVGMSQEVQIPLEIAHWDEIETINRLLIYGGEAKLIDSARIYGNGRRVIAHLHADGKRVRSILEGTLAVGETNTTYEVSDADVAGHFDARSGLPVIFQGIKNVALARTVSDEVRRKNGGLGNVARISNVVFRTPSGPGMTLSVQSDISPQDENHMQVAITRSGSKPVSSCEIDYSIDAPTPTERTVPLEYFTEAAAQALLLAMQRQRKLDNMDTELPLFGGIQEVRIFQHILRGEQVTIDAFADTHGDGFGGNAIVYRPDGSVAQVITGMTGGILPKERVIQYLQKALNR